MGPIAAARDGRSEEGFSSSIRSSLLRLKSTTSASVFARHWDKGRWRPGDDARR